MDVELAHRYDNVRRAMAEHELDALIVSGSEYSGFEGASASGARLADWLRAHDVDAVDVCGIATDHCVRATALDAAREGFTVRVLESLTAAVSTDALGRVHREWAEAGVVVAD